MSGVGEVRGGRTWEAARCGGGRSWEAAERRGAYLARVTVLAVVGLVVALFLPSVGQYAAGDRLGNPPGYSTGLPVRGVDDSR